MRNVDINKAEEGERGADRAATGSIKEPANKTNSAWQKQLCTQAAVMLGDPGRRGTEGPSALSNSVDFERRRRGAGPQENYSRG